VGRRFQWRWKIAFASKPAPTDRVPLPIRHSADPVYSRTPRRYVIRSRSRVRTRTPRYVIRRRSRVHPVVASSATDPLWERACPRCGVSGNDDGAGRLHSPASRLLRTSFPHRHVIRRRSHIRTRTRRYVIRRRFRIRTRTRRYVIRRRSRIRTRTRRYVIRRRSRIRTRTRRYGVRRRSHMRTRTRRYVIRRRSRVHHVVASSAIDPL
jgi:hypothetical protein